MRMTSDYDRAKAVFGSVQQLAGEERAARLAELCGSDAGLRDRVENLLRVHDAVPSSLRVDPVLDDFDLAPDDMVGRYRIVERIGSGGFGHVYEAEQAEPVVRRVAVKVIKPGMDSASVLARFDAERQALAMMDHPSIARVLDAGATDRGRPFFAMELVEDGETIVAHADRLSMSLDARLTLFESVAGGVRHAHQRGIIHRDLKPTNILVARDAAATPKIIDFGIAKAIEGRLTDHTAATAAGDIVGTPEYMAPEQAIEGVQDLDTRCDVYALGVLLYELLAGVLPFDRAVIRERGLAAFLGTIREEFPAAPSTRARTGAESAERARRRGLTPERLSSRLRGELDWIVMKAMEKDRERRYESVGALIDDLGRFRRGEAVLAGPPSAWYRFSKVVQRHRGRVAAIAIVAVTLVVATVVSLGLAVSESKQRMTAVERGEQLAVARDRMARIADFQSSMLADLSAYDLGREMRDRVREAIAAAGDTDGAADPRFERVAAPDLAADVILNQIVDPALVAIEEDFADDPVATGVLLRSLGGVERRLGRARRAIPHLERAVALLDVPERDHERARALVELARAQLADGRPADAEASALAAELLTRGHPGREPEAIRAQEVVVLALRAQARYEEAEPLARANLQANLELHGHGSRAHVEAIMRVVALLIDSRGRLDEAETLADDAVAAARLVGSDDPLLLAPLGYRAWLYELIGTRPLEALPLRREALALATKSFGEEHPDTLRYANLLAWSLRRAQRYDEAEIVIRRNVLVSERVFGPEHPQTLGVRENLAALLMATKRADECVTILRDVVRIHRRDRGDDHPRTLGARNDLAGGMWWLKRFDEAAAEWEALLPLRRRVSGPDHVETLSVMKNLASSWMRLDKLDAARSLLEEVTATYTRKHGAESTLTANTQIVLAGCYRRLERHDDAVDTARAAFDVMQAGYGTDDPAVFEAGQQLGTVLYFAGRYSEAEEIFRHLVAILEEPAEGRRDKSMTCARARLGLGMTLYELERYAEAEAELMTAHGAFAVGGDGVAEALGECEDGLISLYVAWHEAEPDAGHDERAAEWRTRASAGEQEGRAETPRAPR